MGLIVKENGIHYNQSLIIEKVLGYVSDLMPSSIIYLYYVIDMLNCWSTVSLNTG